MRHKYTYYVCIITDKDRETLETAIINTANERSNHLRIEDLASKALERNPECVYIMYLEGYEDVLQAVNREHVIRKMSIKDKKGMIKRMNPEWSFLNDKFYAETR